jgi:hypothetical protein
MFYNLVIRCCHLQDVDKNADMIIESQPAEPPVLKDTKSYYDSFLVRKLPFMLVFAVY